MVMPFLVPGDWTGGCQDVAVVHPAPGGIEPGGIAAVPEQVGHVALGVAALAGDHLGPVVGAVDLDRHAVDVADILEIAVPQPLDPVGRLDAGTVQANEIAVADQHGVRLVAVNAHGCPHIGGAAGDVGLGDVDVGKLAGDVIAVPADDAGVAAPAQPRPIDVALEYLALDPDPGLAALAAEVVDLGAPD